MKIIVTTLLSLVLLSGCASNKEHYAAVQAVAIAEAAAEGERYKALGRALEVGNPTTSALAAVFLGNINNSPKQKIVIAPPRDAFDTFIAFSQVWAAPLVNIYGIRRNADVAIEQNRGSVKIAESTNNTMLGIAGNIQAPAANMTLSGTGVLGTGSYSTSDSHNMLAPTVVTPVVQVVPSVITPIVQVTPSTP